VTAETSRPLPWRLGDLLALYAALAVAATMLFISWWETSGTARQSDQFMWVNVGVAGTVVFGAGAAVWLLTGRRAIGERRLALLPDVADALRVTPAVSGEESEPDQRLVATSSMKHYHRAGCVLAIGKPVQVLSEAGHRGEGRHPCGVCRP